MDYLAEHSSEFFSSDHISVILTFICGVHNYSKDLIVQSLHSFAMKAAHSREHVIINHQFSAQNCCTLIQFLNISFVNITNLTVICPSLNIRDSFITVKSYNIYGYSDVKESLSFISITYTGRGSQALLNNCIFKENCFITSNYSIRISVSNSTFQLYRHQTNSIIIMAFSSVVTLTGNVNFTDCVIGIN
jgi:hypothetical protein